MKKLFLCFLFLVGSVCNAQTLNIPIHTQYNTFQFPGNPIYPKVMDIDINWENDPSIGWGTYAMFWTQFQSGSGAYMGLQQDDREGRKIIFSMWDPSPAAKVRPYNLPHCKRFDHEGSGGQCILSFYWEAGKKYKLRMALIVPSATDVGFSRWGGWLIDTTNGKETFIGAYEVPSVNGLTGVGGIVPSAISLTMEYYAAPNGATCNSMPYNSITWSGLRVDYTTKPYSSSVNYNTGLSVCASSPVVGSYSRGVDQSTMTTNAVVTRAVQGATLWRDDSQVAQPTPTTPTTPLPPPTDNGTSPFPSSAYLDRVLCTQRAVYKHFPQFFAPNVAPTPSRTGTGQFFLYDKAFAVANSQVHLLHYDHLGKRDLYVVYSNGRMDDLGPMNDWIALAGC